MEVIRIIGKNYAGYTAKTRTACRAVIEKGGNLLLSYETLTGTWSLPGGGLEDGESAEACCRREVAEETGVLIRPSECLLEIDEFYEDCRYVNLYFTGEILGETDRHLTPREQAVSLAPRWIEKDAILSVFSAHASFEGIDEIRRGIYEREYTALCALAKQR